MGPMAPAVTIQTAIKNILFTTDFSVASTRAFPWALALARQNSATVHVAHVIAPAPGFLDSYAGTSIEVLEVARHDLHMFLRQRALDGVQYDSVLCHGELGGCISGLIEERKIDLVMVGSKGSMGLKKMVLGSGAEAIFREAPCPVMTVGPHVGACAEIEFKEILFAMEPKETSVLAYPHALALAAQNHARLTVLHVVPPVGPEFADRGLPEYRQHMFSLVKDALANVEDCEKYSIAPKVIVERGAASDVILQVARRLPSDLIVMSVHHARRFATHLPWAIAHEVVADAPCPVLTIRS